MKFLHFLLALILLDICHANNYPTSPGPVTDNEQKDVIFLYLTRVEKAQVRDAEHIAYYHPLSFVPAHNNIGREVLMRFELVRRLGRASNDYVYEALDHLSGKRIALKFFIKIVAMRKECDILKLLKTDVNVTTHCLQIYACGIYRDFGFIIMPLLGPSLQDKLDLEPFTDWKLIKKITFQVATALQHIHRQGLVHNDLNPSNILFKSETPLDLCLVDMGCSEKEPLAKKCRPLSAYEAPEVKFLRYHDRKADMWSLGCLMAELKTGRMLFPFVSDARSMYAVSKLLKGKMPPDDILAANPDLLERVNSLKERAWSSEDVHGGFIAAIPPDVENFATYLQFVDLLKKLFVLEPRQRYDATQVLAHPFLQE